MKLCAFTIVAWTCAVALLSGASFVHAQTPGPAASTVISDLRYEPQYEITRPDGSFILPDERVVTAVVTWRSTLNTGEFQVLARRPQDQGVELRSSVAVTSSPNGTYEFRETWRFFDHPLCYIVRTASAEAEVCRPTPPSSGPPATPTATSWPAPMGLEIDMISLDNPPFFVNLSWDPVPGFTGVYEVQRAATPGGLSDPEESAFSFLATIPSAASVQNRPLHREEVSRQFVTESRIWYRVRAVFGEEAGPFSEEVFVPWNFVGTAEREAPPTPPAAGSGPRIEGRRAGGLLAVGFITVALGSVGSAVLWLRRRPTG